MMWQAYLLAVWQLPGPYLEGAARGGRSGGGGAAGRALQLGGRGLGGRRLDRRGLGLDGFDGCGGLGGHLGGLDGHFGSVCLESEMLEGVSLPLGRA